MRLNHEGRSRWRQTMIRLLTINILIWLNFAFFYHLLFFLCCFSSSNSSVRRSSINSIRQTARVGTPSFSPFYDRKYGTISLVRWNFRQLGIQIFVTNLGDLCVFRNWLDNCKKYTILFKVFFHWNLQNKVQIRSSMKSCRFNHMLFRFQF